MRAWPFTAAEWGSVGAAALPLVNATLAGDEALSESCRGELSAVLADLRARHGEHPVLLETEADFTRDAGDRITLYRRSAALADAHNIQTLTIRLSLAEVLLEAGRPADARAEPLACADEAAGDEDGPKWAALLAAANG